MTAYAKLMSIVAKMEILMNKIQDNTERIDRLRSEAEGLTVAPISDMPHAPSGDQDKLGNTVAEYVDLEEDIDAHCTSYVSEYNKLSDELMSLLDTYLIDYLQHTVLMLRYLCGRSEEEIADITDYPLSTIKRTHEAGIRTLEKKEVF